MKYRPSDAIEGRKLPFFIYSLGGGGSANLYEYSDEQKVGIEVSNP